MNSLMCHAKGGEALLWDALQKDDIEGVGNLLQSGADCNAKNQVGLLAYHMG